MWGSAPKPGGVGGEPEGGDECASVAALGGNFNLCLGLYIRISTDGLKQL